MIDISIVIPVYNEEQNIPILSEKIRDVMATMNRSYECLLVDDGSTDGSTARILELGEKYPEFRPILLRRNFGQTAAMSAGFDHAEGAIIVTLDADLQNDPRDIPKLIQKIDEGYDLATGWRKDRKDSFMRILVSNVANKLIAKITGIQIHDSGCTLKAFRCEVVKSLKLYGEMHRFIPALASWMGTSLVEIPVEHHARQFGKSKYGFSRTIRVILDLITVKFLLSYSGSPIQIFGKIGMLSAFAGMVSFVSAVVLKFTQGRTLTGDPLFYLFIFLEMISIQFILIGLLGELNVRIYHESQNKKTYALKNTPKLASELSIKN